MRSIGLVHKDTTGLMQDSCAITAISSAGFPSGRNVPALKPKKANPTLLLRQASNLNRLKKKRPHTAANNSKNRPNAILNKADTTVGGKQNSFHNVVSTLYTHGNEHLARRTSTDGSHCNVSLKTNAITDMRTKGTFLRNKSKKDLKEERQKNKKPSLWRRPPVAAPVKNADEMFSRNSQ